MFGLRCYVTEKYLTLQVNTYCCNVNCTTYACVWD